MFRNRTDAGRQLGAALTHLHDHEVIVLGLPRGGVPVAFEVAKALDAPLDVIVVRKLGVPFQPELAMGAIGEGDVRVINKEMLHRLQVDPSDLASVESRERKILEERSQRLRRGHQQRSLVGTTAIIVDDGIATGSTIRAACQVVRAKGADRIVIAVPIASHGAIVELSHEADEIITLDVPDPFYAVGQGYADFSETTDDEVVDLLRRSRAHGAVTSVATPTTVDPPVRDEQVTVLVDNVHLAGHLTIPESPVGFVIFAHGSGSGRLSPRNQKVATKLNSAGLATLLFDLLSPDEERNRALVFDVHELARRLATVTAWLVNEPEARGFRIGYFGASTGAAAAIIAAARPELRIDAIVSRGGRPDLAADAITKITAPTLLIVGSNDDVVIDLNRGASDALQCIHELMVVPGATHLFEEPGALEIVSELATNWFVRYLARRD